MSRVYQVVLDTNVLLAALRSRRGASHRLLRLVGDPRFRINLSVPLLLEVLVQIAETERASVSPCPTSRGEYCFPHMPHARPVSHCHR